MFLYKDNIPIAELGYERDRLKRVRVLHREDFPPFLEDLNVVESLRLFLNYRKLPTSHIYYNLSESFHNREAVSYFDGYHLQETEGVHPVTPIPLTKDGFYQATLKGLLPSLALEEPDEEGFTRMRSEEVSHQIALPFSTLSFLEYVGKERFLLQEYSKSLADLKKSTKIPYDIVIMEDIPFIKTSLEEGEYFPIQSLFRPKTSRAEEVKALLSFLKTHGSHTVTPEMITDIPSLQNLFVKRTGEEISLTYV